MTNLEAINLDTLVTVTGGAAQAPSQPQAPADDQPAARTWGQVGREYGAACVTGAAQSLVFGGRPRNAKSAAINAATGCAMGVAMKGVDDLGGILGGQR